MLSSKRHNERSLFLWLIGLMVFNFPLLSLVSGANSLWEIPAVVWYLFVDWLVFILLIFFFLARPRLRGERGERRRD